MTDQPKFISHFEIVRELGRGGMGKVYLSRDTLLDRHVAIKVVRLGEAITEHDQHERETFSKGLLREARIAAALDHPGIVAIYQVGTVDDEPYVVMQFVDGPNLQSILASEPLDRGEITRILKEIAAALDYAHDKGVVHRDIKPSNIMLAGGQTVKLCDFGISKSNMLSRKTSSMLMGTPYYMAPEQLMYQPVDRRADQWALGVVAYQMLTGRLPFQGEDIATLGNQIVYGPLPSPKEVDPLLVAQVTEVLGTVLSKEPAERFATCYDFSVALARALEPPFDTQSLTRQGSVTDQDRTRRTIAESQLPESHFNSNANTAVNTQRYQSPAMAEALEAVRLDREFQDESFSLMIAEMKAGLKASVPMLALGFGFVVCLVAKHYFPSRLWLWIELPILAMLFIAMGVDIVTDIRKQRSLRGRLSEIGVFVFGGLIIMGLIFLLNHVTVK